MSVWVVCPSARPVDQVSEWALAWRERGYRVAILRDMLTPGVTPSPFIVQGAANLVREILTYQYGGYACAVNDLVKLIDYRDPEAEWFIAAGDDVYPDPNHTAEEIAIQCGRYFCELDIDKPWKGVPTFGVMQPTGDRYGEQPNAPPGALRGAYIDRVCGSAWIGREFAKRVNRGNGPLWPEYLHQFVDQELQEVAIKLGVLWQRRDLTHDHRHWARPRGNVKDMPDFLAKANTAEHWNTFKTLFEKRKRDGFPGHEPI